MAELTAATARYHLEQALIAATGNATEIDVSITERVITIFPSPTEVRSHAKEPMPSAQLEALKPVAQQMGIGRKENVLPTGMMVTGPYRAKLEGGMVWKMDAEQNLALSDPNALSITFCASPYVELMPDEVRVLEERYGAQPGDAVSAETFVPTQYGAAEFLARRAPGFRLQEEVHHFGYDIHNGNAITTEQGALRTLGYIPDANGTYKEVSLFRIDRENFEKPDGKVGYRNQPDAAATMTILSEADKVLYGDAETPNAFFTTPTYPSRILAVSRASVETGRLMVTPTAGADLIAEMKGEVPPANAEEALTKLINQVPGELRVIAKQVEASRRQAQL